MPKSVNRARPSQLMPALLPLYAQLDPDSPEADPAHACHCASGIEAPWKKLPYPEKIYAHPKIKHASYQSDTPHKGTMIDFFC